jgi:DNA-directed RNA polymerase specialized sigma24 family protein
VDEGKVAGSDGGQHTTDGGADDALTALYHTHYQSLVRLAALLVPDSAAAEELVQASFVAMQSLWPRLGGGDRALSYLRTSVVRRSRSVRRRHVPGRAIAGGPELGPVVAALQVLPPQQREALVLRYYAGLLDAQIASVMGISLGAVEGHIARAVPSVLAALGQANI